MKGRRRGAVFAVGISAVILLGSAALLRHESPERPAPRGPAVSVDRDGPKPSIESRPAGRGSKPPTDGARPVAESGVVDPEVERVYRDYRVALSTHDRAVEDALYPVLLERRRDALIAARRDAAGATSPEQREWAERAILFLSDPPVPPQYRHPRRDP